MDFGEITEDIVKATGGKMQKAPVILQVGNKKIGLYSSFKTRKTNTAKGL
jgi:hypothetical protein